MIFFIIFLYFEKKLDFFKYYTSNCVYTCEIEISDHRDNYVLVSYVNVVCRICCAIKSENKCETQYYVVNFINISEATYLLISSSQKLQTKTKYIKSVQNTLY